MKVVLKQDVRGTGKKGDIVNVADGYARNFLIVRGLAVEASAQALNDIKNVKLAQEHHAQELRERAENTAKNLNEKTIKLAAKAGQNGKLFGSITSKEIAAGIEKMLGESVDKKKISLESDIKGFGTFTAEIKLHPGVSAKVYVVVSEEE
ncbi:MAG: 50S ribosomal protein L9 [Provencibacterium sp.]|jgi:large subunit ribosomal protein L9|nr:50S ribosomal protein L9 [Provencibacterium sp.]